jgi:hypothetical protein
METTLGRLMQEYRQAEIPYQQATLPAHTASQEARLAAGEAWYNLWTKKYHDRFMAAIDADATLYETVRAMLTGETPYDFFTVAAVAEDWRHMHWERPDKDYENTQPYNPFARLAELWEKYYKPI